MPLGTPRLTSLLSSGGDPYGDIVRSTSGLKAFYRLDSGLDELGGAALDGTGSNHTIVPTVVPRSTGRNGARRGVDTASRIIVPTAAMVSSAADFTVELWVSTTATNTGANGFAWAQGSSTSINPLFALGIKDGKTNMFLRNDAGTTTLNPINLGPNIDDGKPHYLVIRYISVIGVNVFCDGVPLGGGSMPPAPITMDTHNIFGRATTTWTNNFVGAVDELAIYSRGLAGAEIRERWEYGMWGP